MRYTPAMKKYGIVLIVLIVIAIGIFAFTRTGQAPTIPPAPAEEVPATTGAAENPAPSTDTAVAPAPAPSPAYPGVGLGIQQVATNPEWKISLKLDPTWSVGRSGETLTIRSDTATFLVNEDQAIGEPEMVKMTEATRTVAGRTVTARRYESSSDSYAYYEFFELPLGNDTYYFKAKSTVANDPDVETFVAGITIK
jgi:hypothetical protein